MNRTAFLLPSLVALTLAFPVACAAHDDPLATLVRQADATRLLFIGEMHGTTEVPALVAQLAAGISARKNAAGKAQPVVVALEWSGHETGHQAYLASEGTAADKARLLAFRFWSKPYQDGRSSGAMFALLESVRKQAHSGSPVQLATFDLNQDQLAPNRDEGMAQNLRAIVQANPGAKIIALTGNYHARQRPGTSGDPKYRFMANYFADLAPFSLYVDAPRGSYWGCFGATPEDCKSVTFASKGGEAPLGMYTDGELVKIGYSQGLRLAQFTASPPAVTGIVKQ